MKSTSCRQTARPNVAPIVGPTGPTGPAGEGTPSVLLFSGVFASGTNAGTVDSLAANGAVDGNLTTEPVYPVPVDITLQNISARLSRNQLPAGNSCAVELLVNGTATTGWLVGFNDTDPYPTVRTTATAPLTIAAGSTFAVRIRLGRLTPGASLSYNVNVSIGVVPAAP